MFRRSGQIQGALSLLAFLGHKTTLNFILKQTFDLHFSVTFFHHDFFNLALSVTPTRRGLETTHAPASSLDFRPRKYGNILYTLKLLLLH